MAGVKIHEKVCVESILTNDRRVCGVETNKGTIKCDIFINCGGQVHGAINSLWRTYNLGSGYVYRFLFLGVGGGFWEAGRR